MNPATARKLCTLNTRFYAANAASFSQTRTAPWQGWRRCLEACDIALAQQACAQSTAREVRQAPEGASEMFDRLQPRVLSVFDIACGNLRFESFLLKEYPHIDWRLFAIDNCRPFADSGDFFCGDVLQDRIEFTCEDIIGNMLDGLPAAEPANTPALAQAYPFDLVVSFGFMHHIPGFDLRVRFLLEALNHVKPGGYLAVSFWQFMNDAARRDKIEQAHLEALEYHSTVLAEEVLLQQAEETDAVSSAAVERQELLQQAGKGDSASSTAGGHQALSSQRFAEAAEAISERLALDPSEFEPGDYLLGWKNLPGQYRYCHHFTDEEVERLIAELAPYARVAASFSADGKTGNLNRYVVLQRL